MPKQGQLARHTGAIKEFRPCWVWGSDGAKVYRGSSASAAGRGQSKAAKEKELCTFGRFGKTLSRAAPKTSRSSDAAGLARGAAASTTADGFAPLTMRCAILLALAVAAVDARGGGGGGGRNNGAQTPDVSLFAGQVRVMGLSRAAVCPGPGNRDHARVL